MPLAKKKPKQIFPTTKHWRNIQLKTREYYTDTTSLLYAESELVDAEYTHLVNEQDKLNIRQDVISEQFDYDTMCLDCVVKNEKFVKKLDKESLAHAKKYSDGSLCGIFDYRDAPQRWPIPDSLRHSGTYWKADDKEWGAFSAKHGKVTKRFSTVGKDIEATKDIAIHFAKYGKVKKRSAKPNDIDIGALNKILKNTNYKVVSTK
jgi:hypothetical protein